MPNLFELSAEEQAAHFEQKLGNRKSNAEKLAEMLEPDFAEQFGISAQDIENTRIKTPTPVQNFDPFDVVGSQVLPQKIKKSKKQIKRSTMQDIRFFRAAILRNKKELLELESKLSTLLEKAKKELDSSKVELQTILKEMEK